jgi:hypothetical protein
MSWHQKALKGVEDCEKPGETVKRVLIPGSVKHAGVAELELWDSLGSSA